MRFSLERQSGYYEISNLIRLAELAVIETSLVDRIVWCYDIAIFSL